MSSEACPSCGDSSAVRPKLIAIDEAWVQVPGKDPRMAYFADLRADDILPEHKRAEPLEQFVDGYFCEKCGKGFVSEHILSPSRRRYK